MTNQQTEQSILHWPLHGHDRNLSTDDKLKISDIILTDLLAASSHTNIPSLISRNTRKRKHPMNILASTNKRSNTTVMFFPQLNPSIPPLFVVSIENSKSIQTDLNFTLIQQDYDRDIERLKSEINELRKNKFDLQNQHDSTVEQIERCLNITRSLLIEQSQFERKQTRKKAMANRLRLGQFITQRQGMSFVEQWIDGVEFIDKQRAKEQLIRSKDNLDKERKNLSKTKAKQITRKTQSKCQRSSSSSSCCLVAEFNDSSTLTYKDWCEYDEVLRLRQLTYKREEYDLAQDCDRLDRERHLHIRELKRLYNEDQSRFNQNVVLNQRYLLLSLIGKGGFSEVHRAFDLNEQRYVACKIHQLNREWKEEKKANFIKHALREYDIHKHLEHKRIVKLFDVFEIDMNSFCTVLEYCDGNDLDLFLKENKILPEKEARSIIMQLVNALKYLNKDVKPPVIHYDLKPGNVLLGTGSQSGEIKITDFGLSKQMHEDLFDEDDGMDLSSQGAGTYWYLPPEVFVQGPQPPKISSKVDVWSVGCIFYQCLFGRKPFGHNLSQAAVLENKIILNAKEIEFPVRPLISNEAKNFIRRCLTYEVRNRPDVLQLSEDDYLKSSSKRPK